MITVIQRRLQDGFVDRLRESISDKGTGKSSKSSGELSMLKKTLQFIVDGVSNLSVLSFVASYQSLTVMLPTQQK